jgi:Protein of unknown function (DUF3110)
MRVFILLFNARKENEGVHTIQIGDRNKVLMFELEEDAERFGILLEAQDFPTPSVEAIDDDDVKAFCADADYDWELIPAGALAIPPESNLEETSWQPDAKPEDSQEMSQKELDAMRRRLEGLL